MKNKYSFKSSNYLDKGGGEAGAVDAGALDQLHVIASAIVALNKNVFNLGHQSVGLENEC